MFLVAAALARDHPKPHLKELLLAIVGGGQALPQRHEREGFFGSGKRKVAAEFCQPTISLRRGEGS